MRLAILTRIFEFEASHHLPGHRGRCRRPHGHSYRLEISLRGPILNAPGESDDGMVMDLDDLKNFVNHAIIDALSDSIPLAHDSEGGLDHNNLNEITGIRTTAENLVHWIWDALVAAGLPEDLLYRVRLWETARGYAEITRAERGLD
ncbi:MAG: 6-carboxytetrahydropterin synthase [Chloroflexi bacterium]|nr:6-carboxytetrahydropterin synthase [Ktedonobacteraceae bacterium]MBV8822357.1 6-carboxytetrahydropterin synthase [Ktedonobacteraceae bacterium]MBV9022009.1 6-carboxytetrahydropterin synthase [Ktedonobacteraceae bacterium]MBV9708771.1 6-carboxytetrahydropterin synthase [Chloroflexota bacterium]